MRIYGKVVDAKGNLLPAFGIAQCGPQTGGTYDVSYGGSYFDVFLDSSADHMKIGPLSGNDLELNIVFKGARTVSPVEANAEFSVLMDNAPIGNFNKKVDQAKNGLNKLFGSAWGWLIGLGIAVTLAIVFRKKISGLFVSLKKKL